MANGNGGMNSSHVAVSGGVTAMVADVLLYISHWPLMPLDAATATSLAGLMVAAAAGLTHLYQTRYGSKSNGNGVPASP